MTRPLTVSFGADLPRGLNLLRRAIVLTTQLVILAITFRAATNVSAERSFSLWIATMLILTPVVWLHYMVLLLIPFGMIAVAAVRRETSERVWRSAILSYCLVVLVTPLMSTLTFRQDIMEWRVSAVAEVGFAALLSAWVAAYRFAAEPSSESSGTEDRRQAAHRNWPRSPGAVASKKWPAAKVPLKAVRVESESAYLTAPDFVEERRVIEGAKLLH